MDPKKQAEMFYKSLIAADVLSCKLLTRGASIQRGRAAALKLKLIEQQQQQQPILPPEEIAKLSAEMAKRTALAEKLVWLDTVVDEAIVNRAKLDKNKFK